MSAHPYKGGLTVGGPGFDKSKLQLRRPTPDSDALASSDEDRDHVPPARSVANPAFPGGRRPSTGWLQDIQRPGIQPTSRKFSLPSVSFASSQPTTPSLEAAPQSRPNTSAFQWTTPNFTSNSSGTRFKEVLPSPTSAHPPGDRALPSPTAVKTNEGIGFLLNQQNSPRKSVRSQSYSVGQGDLDNPAAQLASRLRTSVRQRTSKPSLLGESALGLAQLREDDIDEIEPSNGSQQGVQLPAGYWDRERDQKQVLLQKAAMENARARNSATSTGSPVLQVGQRNKPSQSIRPASHGEYAIEEQDDAERVTENPKLALTRRFSEHVGGLGRDAGMDYNSLTQSPNWTTGNIQALGEDALGRRHSFAHYGSHAPGFQNPTLGNTKEEDEEDVSPLQQEQSPGHLEPFDTNAYFTGLGPASRAINASAISAAHPAPAVQPQPTGNPYAVPANLGRPGRRHHVVTFKCSRADVYYTFDNTGLEIRTGDLVITEGDRGVDLGQVTHADVSLDDAKNFKRMANEEHFRWLVMFSQYSLAGSSNENPMLGALARANGFPNNMNRSQLTGMGVQQDQDAKPRMIKRLAQQHEIESLREKEGHEAKAKRIAVGKAAEFKFVMEILDAEYQADRHKLTFFYFAEHYVNFNPLVVDLFKQWKIRIWMSAVNPASVVNPASQMQPSAIGPGAIIHSNATNASVGTGFGNDGYRANNHPQQQQGRGRGAAQTSYDENYYPFSHQLAGYAAQAAYQMPWGQAQHMPDMYGRYGYPNATAGGSPMNQYGTWYPPATYSASPAFNNASSGASYRGGYPATSSAGHSYNPYATSGTGAAGNHSVAPAFNPYAATAGYGASTGYGNNTTATAENASTAGHDSTELAAAMDQMSFGN